MWSRRKFVFSTLAGLALWADGQNSIALGVNRQRKQSFHIGKPVLLVGEYWSPAIACDFIGVLTGDICCIVDEFGRLVTANILPPVLHSHIFPVLGRLDDLGNKVYDIQFMPQMAVAVVGAQEGKLALTVINLTRAKSPSVVSRLILPDFGEFHAMVARQSFVCLAGTTSTGNNNVSFYKFKRGRKWQLEKLSSLSLVAPVENMLLADKDLLIMHGDEDNRVSIVDLKNLSQPQILRTVKLGIEDNQISCSGDAFAWASMQESGCIVKTGDTKDFPQAHSQAHIDVLQSVEAVAMNGDNLMVFGDSKEESAVIPFLIDENKNLHQGRAISLHRRTNDQDMTGKLVLGRSNAFIGFGWDGVQVLSLNKNGAWAATSSYSVPKLPVASQIAWSNYLVLAGADLRLYDLQRPAQPQLVNVSKLPKALKKMVLAGSYVLCLDQNSLSLRKIENLPVILAQLPVGAKELSFDASSKKAYLIQADDGQDKDQHQHTKLLEVNVYTDKIETGKLFTVVNDAYCSSADGGYVLVGNLDGLAVYKPDQDKELVCKRQFQNLAWRDIILTDGKIFATAVDREASGFFYTMSFDGQEIAIDGVTKMPHDGLALVVTEKYALSIGQNPDGSNLLVVIDLSDLSSPKIASVQPVLDSAGSIACTDGLAIVSGRGFEIFKLKD